MAYVWAKQKIRDLLFQVELEFRRTERKKQRTQRSIVRTNNKLNLGYMRPKQIIKSLQPSNAHFA